MMNNKIKGPTDLEQSYWQARVLVNRIIDNEHLTKIGERKLSAVRRYLLKREYEEYEKCQ